MLRGFIRKKVASYTLGEQLKNIRSERRITLHEVSRETKIPVKYLEMIEEGKYEDLPPDVYVKGFLRSYAEFLDVDSEKLINLYRRERDIKSNIGSNSKMPERKNKKGKIPYFVITPRVFTISIIAIVVLGGFFYLYKEIGRFASVPRLVLTQPSSSETSVDGNSITLVGRTDGDAKLTINDQPVIVSDSGEFKENILLQEDLNTIVINSTNRFNKTATKVVNIKANYDKPDMAIGDGEENNQGGEISGEQDTKKEGLSITIRTDSLPTWISVEADGNIVYSGTMLPGTNQEFSGEKEIRVTSGKANQTFVKVNNKAERKLADDAGIVRDVLFTPSD